MESVQCNLLLLVFFLIGSQLEAYREELEANRSEEICAKLTRRPFFNYEFILGHWRVYYNWGIKIRKCQNVKIKPVSDSTKDRFSEALRDCVVEQPDWYGAELMVVLGDRISELLMFPEGDVRGRFKALTNVRRIAMESPPHHVMRYTNYAFKAFIFFKYLVLINCSKFRGYLMARPNDTTVTIKEIMSVVDGMKLGVEGSFACLP